MLTDDEIAAMTPAQRRELILRLSRSPADLLPSPERVRRIRRARLALTVGGCVVLVPWTFYLAVTLPRRYVAHHWDLVWVGFDVLLLAMLALTAWLGWQRRQAMVLTSFATGVLVLADAWFDVLTAQPDDAVLSVVVAALVEVPVALLLISAAIRMVRLTAARFWVASPDTPFWKLPMLVFEGVDPDTLEPTTPSWPGARWWHSRRKSLVGAETDR